MHQKVNAKGAITQFNEQMKKPEAKQTDCEKLRKTFLNSNATWYKNELFLQFYKWVRREKKMKLLIVNYADRQMIRAGKLEKSSQG